LIPPSDPRSPAPAGRSNWTPLLFEDETQEDDRQTRDPVAPATPSVGTRRKTIERQTADGLPLHSLETLLTALATRRAVRCRLRSDPTGALVRQVTPASPLQALALAVLGP
jgi:hypothetical protein